MPDASTDESDAKRRTWTDLYVRVRPGLAPWTRFANRIGKVITLNANGNAIIDFADGAWYDLPATDDVLELVADDEGVKGYDATVNSSQARPTRQG